MKTYKATIYDYLEAIHCEVQEVQKTTDITDQQLIQLYALIENARELIS